MALTLLGALSAKLRGGEGTEQGKGMRGQARSGGAPGKRTRSTNTGFLRSCQVLGPS